MIQPHARDAGLHLSGYGVGVSGWGAGLVLDGTTDDAAKAFIAALF